MKNICYIVIAAALTLSFGACSKDSAAPDTVSSTGQGGSLARYTIAGGYLYMVDMRELKAFSLANPTDPVLTQAVQVGTDIETIFAYKDKLFIGSREAMYIYSIASPGSPQLLGQASHVRACDPVVANDSIAYVTVRSGTDCGGTVNALYVYDVTNVLNPIQRNAIALSGPWGLGMSGNRLYVCEGGQGLMIYDISNPQYPSYINKVSGETFYDVIIDKPNNLLICMVQGGTSLYEINGDNLTKLAKIAN